MTSLTDVYEGDVGSVAGRRRRLLGTALYLAGAVAVVGAIPVATAEGAQSLLGLEVYEARQLAGILAGLGLPAVFVGIFAVLPASPSTRAAAAIGASLSIFGVVLFVHAYPYSWLANDTTMALATTILYSLGLLTTFWCMFLAVATFKLRNDPGGTARMEVTEEGTVRVIRGESPSSPLGGIGLFGNDPEGDVATQTNRPDGGTVPDATTQADEGEVLTSPDRNDSSGTDSQPSPTGDGAGAIADPSSADDDIVEAVNTRGQPDRYCGNCEHFEYVRADDDLAAYCGLRDDLMDDMDACDEWSEQGHRGRNPGA